MRNSCLFALLAAALLCTVPALAQSGCDDSPENPTVILAVLAGGVYSANALRTRVRARRPLGELSRDSESDSRHDA